MEFMQFTTAARFLQHIFRGDHPSFRGVGVSGNFFSEDRPTDRGFVVRRRRSYLRSPAENGPGGVVKFFRDGGFTRSIASNIAQFATTAQNAQISHKIAINGYIIPQRMIHHKHTKTTQSPQKPPNCRARDPFPQSYPADTDDRPTETANVGSGEDAHACERREEKTNLYLIV
jgi:hypothetical protein